MADYEGEGLLHEMFTRQAKLSPDGIAIVNANGETVSFKVRLGTYWCVLLIELCMIVSLICVTCYSVQELDSCTDRLAQYLRVVGVKPDTIVGIYMERSVMYVIAYIAILKAGNYFKWSQKANW